MLDRVLTPTIVASALPKKDVMTVLPYLGKLSLLIRTIVDRVIRNKLHYCNLKIVFQTKCKLIIFFCIQRFLFAFLFFYVLSLFRNLSAVAVMLPIVAKLSAILKSECLNTFEFLLLLERKCKWITIINLVLLIFPY